MPFVSLLSEIVGASPIALVNSRSANKIREAMDYVSHIDTATATLFMSAVQPVVGISLQLRDSLMLVLRKALFSRDEQARTVAVTGFIMILVDVTNRSASSSASQSSTQESANVEAMALEILGTLRRCLTQQGTVRAHLYKGLSTVAADRRCGTSLRATVLDVLLPQYEAVKGRSDEEPINFEACIRNVGTGNALVVEPLSHLLACIGATLIGPRRRNAARSNTGQSRGKGGGKRKGGAIKMEGAGAGGGAAGAAADDDGDAAMVDSDDDVDSADADFAASSIYQEAESTMQKISLAFSKASLRDDFNLENGDSGTNFSLDSGDGMFNCLKAQELIGAYESLICFMFASGDRGVDAMTSVVNVQKKRHELSVILSSNEKKEKKGGGGILSRSGMCAGVDLTTASEMFRAVLRTTGPGAAHGNGFTILRNSDKFVRFAAWSAHCCLERLHSLGSGLEMPTAAFEACTEISISAAIAIVNAGDDEEEDTASATEKSQAGGSKKGGGGGGGGGGGKKAPMFRGKKGKPLLTLCAESLQLAVGAMCRGFSHRLSEFLTALGAALSTNSEQDDDDGDDDGGSGGKGAAAAAAKKESELFAYTWFCEQLVTTIDAERFKICGTFVAIVNDILACTCVGGVNVNGAARLRESVAQLCTDHRGLQDAPLGKALVGVLLDDESQGTDAIEFLATDALNHIGYINDEDADQESAVFKFKLVSVKLCESGMVPTAVIQAIDKRVGEVDWVLPRLSAISARVNRKVPVPDARENLCDLNTAITERLLGVVKAADTLGSTYLEDRICTNVFKSCTKLYATLTNLLKFRLTKVAQKYIEQSAEFRELAKQVFTMTETMSVQKDHVHFRILVLGFGFCSVSTLNVLQVVAIARPFRPRRNLWW